MVAEKVREEEAEGHWIVEELAMVARHKAVLAVAVRSSL